jgi:3-hydroxymyristoyl/3-hydroxydecanoyl-(acyl carrier protein) dehydratase
MNDVHPVIVERKVDSEAAEIVLRIPAGLKYLRGHFPRHPVVPGVVQIKWALEEGIRHFGFQGGVAALEAIKFNRIMQPEDEVTLSLRLDTEKGKLHFSYRSADGAYSSGRILLQGAA